MALEQGPATAPVFVFGDPDEEITATLSMLRRLLKAHPQALRAGIRWLAREGRVYARTAEGQLWRQNLEGSDLVRRGRSIWEALTLNMLEDDETTPLPSALLESMLGLLSAPNLEPILSRMFTDDMKK